MGRTFQPAPIFGKQTGRMNVAFVIIIALLGWASNIYVLATDSSLTIGEAVLHGVGIIVFPLGSLLGIISWFA